MLCLLKLPRRCALLELFFCCTCGETGTINASRREWLAKTVEHICPRCDKRLLQRKLHFEILDRGLQRERLKIIYKPGSLTRRDRVRLHEIHDALGNPQPETLTHSQVDLVLDRTWGVLLLVQREIQEARATG